MLLSRDYHRDCVIHLNAWISDALQQMPMILHCIRCERQIGCVRVSFRSKTGSWTARRGKVFLRNYLRPQAMDEVNATHRQLYVSMD